MRNMEGIFKLQWLLPELEKHAAKLHASFKVMCENELRRDYWAAPFSMMESSDTMFKCAAEHKLWAFLAARVKQAMDVRQRAMAGETFEAQVLKGMKVVIDPVTFMDVTMDDLKDWANDEFMFLRPMPGSSSESHNLAERHLLHTLMEFRRDRWSYWEMFRNAQMADEEYMAWRAEDNERARVEREKRQAAEALAEQRAKDARRDVRRLVRTTAGPNFCNSNVFVGWPTLADVQRIRDDGLRAYVGKVHELYQLNAETRKIEKRPAR